MLSGMEAEVLLRRFCFLGSFECIYQYHGKKDINVGIYWPQIKQLCSTLDHKKMEILLKQVLQQAQMNRYDEVLFIYACYLESSANAENKLAVRQIFPQVVSEELNMLLFCKYARLIRREEKLKGFSKTVRKAINSWYKAKAANKLEVMCLNGRGAHGFTHRELIRLCYVNDETLGATHIYKVFSEKANGWSPMDNDTKKQQNWQAVYRLRCTDNKEEALKLITTYDLKYAQIPAKWLKEAEVLSLVITSIKFWQLLEHWRLAWQQGHNPEFLGILQKQLMQRNIIRAADVHPVSLIMQFQELGIRSDYKMLNQGDNLKVPFIRDLYDKCFGKNRSTGLRMHFSINLQESYKKKLLKHCGKVSYFHAAIALAFGYFKKETTVDVSYWSSEKFHLLTIPWCKEMNVANAITVCDSIVNTKNSQLLTVPVSRALHSKQKYDVFVAVVPTAGRGNVNNCSEQLSQLLDKYRSTVNPKAKYVIVNLMRYRKSMQYSNKRTEHILEICGIDENTCHLINNFALNYFD